MFQTNQYKSRQRIHHHQPFSSSMSCLFNSLKFQSREKTLKKSKTFSAAWAKEGEKFSAFQLETRPPLKMDPARRFSPLFHISTPIFFLLLTLLGVGESEKSKWRWFPSDFLLTVLVSSYGKIITSDCDFHGENELSFIPPQPTPEWHNFGGKKSSSR